MLLTDSIFLYPDDLIRIDSESVSVASNEGITLTGANGLLRQAYEDMMLELTKIIISFGGYLNSGDLSANHLAAVLNVGIGNSVRQKVGLQQVVMSGAVPGQWNQLKMWTVYWALRALYRDAFSRTVNDRYKKKYDFLKDEMARRITPTVNALGIPVVTSPLVRPAAFFEINSGTWTQANVSLVAGAGTLDSTNSCDVAITYVNALQPNFYQSQLVTNNSESNPSDTITQTMGTGEVLSVSIATLNPPTGAQAPAQVLTVVVSPGVATGWNVYVGKTGQTLYLQNATPIPIATKTYTLAGDPTFSGYPVGVGQYNDRNLSITPTRQRA